MKKNPIVEMTSGGFVEIPLKIRQEMGLSINIPRAKFEVIPNYNDSEIILRRPRHSFSVCATEWYNNNKNWLNRQCRFITNGDFTFCIVNNHQVNRAGHAKRCANDIYSSEIGRVAAYANAMNKDLNKMIGYME